MGAPYMALGFADKWTTGWKCLVRWIVMSGIDLAAFCEVYSSK